jgi:hypothetical protein
MAPNKAAPKIGNITIATARYFKQTTAGDFGQSHPTANIIDRKTAGMPSGERNNGRAHTSPPGPEQAIKGQAT